MTSQEREKITKRMLWIIPAMIPCIIGDYCMGLEPKGSTAVSFMISAGWLTIADWRIALSHIGGLVGTALYMIAALAFVQYLNEKLACCGDKWGRRFLKLFLVGLYWGCMVFVYFHLACGTLIHIYNVLFEAGLESGLSGPGCPILGQLCRAGARHHRRLDRHHLEGRAAAEKTLGAGSSDDDRRNRVSAGTDPSAALQRLCVGL